MLELLLLGPPLVRVEGHEVRFRTSKALALLAYLAVEGRQPREALSDLLWDEQTQDPRAELRGTLHHLRTALGNEAERLKTSVHALWLDLEEAVLDLHVLDAAAPDALLGVWRGPFLAGLSVWHAPRWDDWVVRRGLELQDRYDTALGRASEAALARSIVGTALLLARRRVEVNLLSEAAYLGLIRAQLAAGQRAEAYATFVTCRRILREELGVEPSFRLDGLRWSVADQAASSPAPLGDTPAPVPFVGRERELRQMEEAWARSPVVFLAGEAGSGKSRLAREFFALRKQKYFVLEARHADADVPFAVGQRVFRAVLPRINLRDVPDEVRRELSRIVPEFWPEPLPPLRVPEDRLRFYEAFVRFIALAWPLDTAALYEDLHFWDLESHRAGAYGATHGTEQGAVVPCVVTYRSDELRREMLDLILPVVALGHATIIEVSPLTVAEVHALLHSLDPRVSDTLAARLHRFTGGNPLFVFETARLLQECGGLVGSDLRELPRSPNVSAVLLRRLQRVSEEARRVVQAAAVAGEAFSFDLARRVLAADDLRLAAAYEELEAAGVLRGERWTHDLWRACLYDALSAPVRTVLHSRVLDALSGGHTPVAVLAQHAREARRWSEAFALFLRAANEARAVLALTEAAAFEDQARRLLRTHGGPLREEEVPAAQLALLPRTGGTA
ncbi:AAA family ATPase [Deinococcus sp. YIM 77859]|uniref:AAA family ATPase n=1 Tax=Deinococcus sp. YIM 77859 TaxID=1540221 RepID=UPI000555023D|nr:AAA family ATPase [Deinococcus sp. YIM 77859]